MSPSPSRFPLWARVLVGVIAGAALGVAFRQDPWLFGYRNADLGPVGMLAVRLLKALATPLVFLSIVDAFLKTAISARSGLRLAAVCLLNVSVAMTIGLVLLDGLQPGARWAGQLEALGAVLDPAKGPAKVQATLDPLANLAGFVPESVVGPFSDNLVLSVVLLAVLTGASLREVRDHAGPDLLPAVATTGHVVEVAQRAVAAMLMKVAELMPFAVALIVADVVGKAGLGVFSVLWVFLATMLAGLLLHALGWYPLLAWVGGRMDPRRFLRAALDPVVTAVSCNSSLATMPVTLAALDQLGVREEPARLSACVGTNFNNDGIMLYEAMATLFLCQAMGMDLPLTRQLSVVGGLRDGGRGHRRHPGGRAGDPAARVGVGGAVRAGRGAGDPVDPAGGLDRRPGPLGGQRARRHGGRGGARPAGAVVGATGPGARATRPRASSGRARSGAAAPTGPRWPR
jgi:Na+/H+-dicarboxylate symporter